MFHPLTRFIVQYVSRLTCALVWPIAERSPVSFALFRYLYGSRPWSDRMVRRISQGWYSLEWGSWTLEVCTSDRIDAWVLVCSGRMREDAAAPLRAT